MKKLDSETREAVFTGYATNAYRLWDPVRRENFLSRNVAFTLKAIRQFNEALERNEQSNQQEEDENQGQNGNPTGYNLRARRNINPPLRYQDYIKGDPDEVMLNYSELMEVPDKQKWKKVIEEIKL